MDKAATVKRNINTPSLQYITDLHAYEDQILRNTYCSMAAERRHQQISAAEGKMLAILVKLAGVRSILEIGTGVGYSTIWLARSLPKDGYIITIERDQDYYNQASINIKSAQLEDSVELILADAAEYLKDCSNIYDAIFIDANKVAYPKYLSYADRLLKPGGLLIADNTFLFGNVYQENKIDKMTFAMRDFNKQLAQEYESIIIPTLHGLSVGIKLK